MINRVVLVGRLTKDPELRYTPSGVPMTRFTIAVNRTFTNQQGEREADFISCVAWRKQAENLANFMKKGNLIGIEGRIQTGSYEGQDGKRVYTTDVVVDSVQFLEPRSAGTTPQYGTQQYGNQPAYSGQPYSGYSNQDNMGQYQPNQPIPNQPGYTTSIDDDILGENNKGKIDLSEDDLPF